MEVKPGYKQTQVGVIPNEWEAKHLGELGSIVRGGSPRPAGDPRYFGGNFIPWLTVAALTNIPEYQLLVTETASGLTEEGSKHSRTLVDGTVIIANSGATLGVAKLLGVTCCANDGIAAITDQRVGDKAFVCHYINTRTQHLREVVATGNGQPNLNTALIREISIPFPPLPEQRAIAEALSDIDALLVGLDRLIAKKRDLKQAAMQQLLTGQTRLPGFQGEWEVRTVAELERQKVVKLSRGQVISKRDIDRKPGDFPIYSSSIHNDGLFGCYGEFMFDEELITWSVDGGGNFFYRQKHKFSVTNVCGFMRVDASKIDYRFFAVQLQLLHSRKNFDYQSKAHPSVIRKEYEVRLPSLPEQRALAAVLSDMDAELTALEARRDKTRALKQGMMQELLTGRTRLI